MMRYVPVIGFGALVLLLALMLVVRHVPNDAAPKPLPTVTLVALDGHTAWEQDALKGKVTLINIFASWCTPCAAEMPELAVLKKQFPGVELQGIAWNDDPKTLKKWLGKNGNPFRTVWLDAKGDATIALGLKGVPETLIIDHKGMVRYRLAGILTPAGVTTTIGPLLTQLLEEAHAN